EYHFFAVEIGIERARRYTRLRGDINQTGVQIPIPLKDDPGCLKQLVPGAYTAGSRGKFSLLRVARQCHRAPLTRTNVGRTAHACMLHEDDLNIDSRLRC